MDAIYALPTWVLVAAVIVPTIAAAVLGRQLGVRHADAADDRVHALNNGLRASILGLVALLLGFTYAMSSGRYAERQRIVHDEANAVGTCYLRAGLLPEGAGQRVRAALRRWTDLRLELFARGTDPAAVTTLNGQMDAQLNELWAAIENSAKSDPDRTHKSYIVPSANEVIDLTTTRRWSARNKVPPVVLILLAVCMIVSGGVTAHALARRRGAAWVLWSVQLALTTLVLFVTLDLDRPARGLIEVDHQPLEELRASFQSP